LLIQGLATAGVILLAAEGLLAWFDIANPARLEDPYVGFHDRTPFFVPDPQHPGSLKANRSAYRLRPQSFSRTKPVGVLRIALLGGSNVHNLGLKLDRFSQELQGRLAIRRVELINAGIGGYGTARLVRLAEEVLGYDLDLLIFYEGHNDFEEFRLYRQILEESVRAQRRGQPRRGGRRYCSALRA
jgi:hypothetical protein